MHHHNKKQGLSGNEKVLFKGKESGLFLRVRKLCCMANTNPHRLQKTKAFKKAVGKEPTLKLL